MMTYFDDVSRQFATYAGDKFRKLLETKHLYQKQPLAIREFITLYSITAGVPEIENKIKEKIFLEENPTFTNSNLRFTIPITNIKIVCDSCGGREAFRPIWFADITEQLLTKRRTEKQLEVQTFRIKFPQDFQLWVLVYQCQACENIPNAFLVKRAGTDLFIEGRSPIEQIELPKFIPREEQKWFRDAVIAYQTAKILAGLFYLRTFIEQFARRKTGTVGDRMTGDEILSAYAGMLPDTLRDTMPSLKEWYDRLSEAIHGAKEDAVLFESARQNIEKHFDVRRVHDLDSKDEKAAEAILKVATEGTRT